MSDLVSSNLAGWFGERGYLRCAGTALGVVALAMLLFAGMGGGWLMTKTLWPGLHGDAALYSTVIINRSAGEGQRFSVYLPALLQDNGERTFAGHGQLYYPVVAWFLAAPSYQELLRLLHFANLACLVLGFVVFSWTARVSMGTGWLFSAFLGAAGAFATVGVLHYVQGRPEHGIPFVLLIFALVRLIRRGKSLPDWVEGLQIGTLAALSPVPGALFGLINVMCLKFESPVGASYFRKCLARAVYAGIFWLLLTYFASGSNPLTQLTNSASWAGMYLWNPCSFSRFWMEIPYVPFAVMPFAAAGILFFGRAFVFFKSPDLLVNKAIFSLVGIAAAYPVWKHFVAWSDTNYTLLPFLPAVGLWFIRSSGQMLRQSGHITRVGAYAVALLVLALPGLGFLRTSLAQPQLLASGASYSNALDAADRLRAKLGPSEVIMIDRWNNARSAVVLDRYPLSFVTDGPDIPAAEAVLGIKAKYYLVLQDFRVDPPPRAGFRLLEDRFNRRALNYGPLQLFDHILGFGYAVYAREET